MGAQEGSGDGAGVPIALLAGHAGIDSATARTNDCARPVRLRGSTQLVDTATGEARVPLLLGPGAGRVHVGAVRQPSGRVVRAVQRHLQGATPGS